LGDEIIRNTAFRDKAPSDTTDSSPFFDEGEEDYETYQPSVTDKNGMPEESEKIVLTTNLSIGNVTLNGSFRS